MSEAKLAATVVVLRPVDTGAPELLLVRRTRGASFMADAFVFPGGRLDDNDGVGETGLRIAAARELREEAGVTIDPMTIEPFARWITPSAEPKRFDATFFIGDVPAGTEARVDAAEVTELLWASARDILAKHELGGMTLPPPTLRTLEDLAPIATIDDALAWARGRTLDPILPKLLAGDEMTILLPWDKAYAKAEGEGSPVSKHLGGGTTRYVLRGRQFIAMK